MARRMIPREAYAMLAKRIDVTPERAQFIWESFVDMIAGELLQFGEFRFFGLCTIILRESKGRWTHIPLTKEELEKAPEGQVTKKVYLEPKQKLTYRTSEAFKEVINYNHDTKLEIKKKREIARAQELYKSELERQAENARKADEAFAKGLEVRREKQKKKLDNAVKRGRKKKKVYVPPAMPDEQPLDY